MESRFPEGIFGAPGPEFLLASLEPRCRKLVFRLSRLSLACLSPVFCFWIFRVPVLFALTLPLACFVACLFLRSFQFLLASVEPRFLKLVCGLSLACLWQVFSLWFLGCSVLFVFSLALDSPFCSLSSGYFTAFKIFFWHALGLT